MVDASTRRIALLCLLVAAMAGCGKKGPLYLPDAASEVVTRPAAESQPVAPAPAPEVSTEETKKDATKKEPGATPPPPQ